MEKKEIQSNRPPIKVKYGTRLEDVLKRPKKTEKTSKSHHILVEYLNYFQRNSCLLSCIFNLFWIIFYVYAVVITGVPTLKNRLGLSWLITIGWLFAMGYLQFVTPSFNTNHLIAVNIPLYFIINNFDKKNPISYELAPIWLLKCLNREYRRKYSFSFFPKPNQIYCRYVGINVVGGLIPISIALYQLSRLPLAPVILVTFIVTVLTYFWVNVNPIGIISLNHKFLYLVVIIASLSSLATGIEAFERAEVSLAFASAVLGTTIGADILHLKDLKPQKFLFNPCIGGAGEKDLIWKSGLFAFFVTEWLLNILDFFAVS